MSGLLYISIRKTFGANVALESLDLDVRDGELISLLGPSGCGKTTALRIAAGFEFADSGAVTVGGADITRTPAHKRNMGMVFQSYSLFPNLTVSQNVEYGLRTRKVNSTEHKKRVADMLELVQLGSMGNRYPHQLSGGQRQRIALARALAVEPKVLLLDEPFGALDAKVRKELRRWLRRLHDEMHVTSVFVTHDQEEAMEVADRVVVMNHGRIEQEGTPDHVYDHPATSFVLQFLGDVNLFHGRFAPGDVGYVRPHELDIVAAAEEGSFPATLVQALTVGPRTRIEFRSDDDGSYVDVELPRAAWFGLRERLGLHRGSTVHLKPRHVTRFTAAQDGDEAMPSRL